MNFDIDYRHVNIVAKSPRTVPVLVLIREWGRLKQDPYSQTEVIQLILEGIQPLANFEEGLVSMRSLYQIECWSTLYVLL